MAKPDKPTAKGRPPVRPGALVLIGGAEDKVGGCRVLREFVRLAGGSRSRIGIATIASEIPVEVGAEYAATFRRLGCRHTEKIDVPDRDTAGGAETAAKLEALTGVFFTGGNQARITNLIGGTLADQVLHRRQAAGELVIGGTSAGAAMMSGTMIVGGPNEASPRVGVVEIGPGLEFLHGVMVDQHFTRRGRTGRLIAALARYPHLLGVGIDEDTALIAEGDEFRVAGSGAVTVIDLGAATANNVLELADGEHLGICGVRMHVLPDGFRFRLSDRTPVPPVRPQKHHGGDDEIP